MMLLPQPENVERVETGVLQFGEDWPGVFFRGDDALYYATVLNGILKDLKKSSMDYWAVVDLIRIFSEAKIR